MIRFSFYLKNNQTKFKKNETGSNRSVSIRFGYFRTKIKTQLTGFGFSSVRLFYIKNKKTILFFEGFFVTSNGFDFGLAWFIRFGFLLISVQFGFLVSGLWNQNRTKPVSFLNILIRLIDFFHGLIIWFNLFFSFFLQ